MKRVSLLFLATFLCFSFAALAEEPVALKSSVELHRGSVKLSDVFTGVPEEKDQDIALAPLPGKSVIYPVKILVRLAEQHGLGWLPEGLTDRCVLTRAARDITPEMVQERVLAKIKETDVNGAHEVRVQFDSRFVGLSLPAEQEPEFSLEEFTYDRDARRFRAEIVAAGGDGRPLRQKVSGRVMIQREIPVLARRIPAGTVVSADDLLWETIVEEKMPTDAVVDAAEIIGKETRRDQNQGEAVRRRDLIPPRLVTRGSLVTMKIESSLLQITAQGKALQDGGKGDVVRVINTQSNRTVEGVVEASGVVRVGAVRKVASVD